MVFGVVGGASLTYPTGSFGFGCFLGPSLDFSQWERAFRLGRSGVSESGDAVVVVDAGAEVVALRARLVQSELKAAAIRAGMVDLDGVKLIDMAEVKIGEDGGVLESEKVMAALRVAKPWLFPASSSSSAAVAPRARAAEAKGAMAMSLEEWRAARAEMLRRR